MNPIVLLGVGALALMAFGKKGGTSKTTTNGNGADGNGGTTGNGNGNGNGNGALLDLGNYLSLPGKPVPGTLYPVSAVDVERGILGIASQAIWGTRTMTAAGATDYAQCINDSDWNGWLYGEEAPGGGVYATLALHPINADALFAVRHHKWPVPYGHVMAALATGTAEPPTPSGKYGLLWLPPAELTSNPDFPGQAGTVECPVGTWDGGRSTKDPPSTILRQLGGARPDWMPGAGEGLSL